MGSVNSGRTAELEWCFLLRCFLPTSPKNGRGGECRKLPGTGSFLYYGAVAPVMVAAAEFPAVALATRLKL